ncbi:MAG: YdcF family protein [Actinomycetes bacterium]
MRLVLRAVGRLVALVVALLLVLVVVTAVRIVAAGEHDDRRRSDAIVVLGAAQYNGRPGPYLQPRLEHAAELYSEGVAPVVITTGGGQPTEGYTEAQAGRDWLVRHGVPSTAVLAVPEGGDTRGSTEATAAAMKRRGWHSAVVVTDPWHSLRASSMLEHQGIDAVASHTTTGPSNAGFLAAAKYTARETVAYLYWLWQRVTT